MDAASQAVKKLPFDDLFLNNARFLNLRRRRVHLQCCRVSLYLVFKLAEADTSTDGYTAGGIYRLSASFHIRHS